LIGGSHGQYGPTVGEPLINPPQRAKLSAVWVTTTEQRGPQVRVILFQVCVRNAKGVWAYVEYGL
jgi:hypothetical protein